MSYFTTGGPGKEHRTNTPPPTGRAQERSKRDTTCPTTSRNPSLWHPAWLNKACTTRKDSESEWWAKDNPETNPITMKPDTASHVAKRFSWAPSPSCSPPGRPFPIKSLAFSACFSSDNSFLSVRQEPSFGPWKGTPFLQHQDTHTGLGRNKRLTLALPGSFLFGWILLFLSPVEASRNVLNLLMQSL